MSKLALLVLQLAVCNTVLSAQTWSWNYSGSGGDFSTSASGTFVTSSIGSGNYLITDVTGVWNGVNITGVLAPGADFNDNVLSPSSPYVDFNGVSFTTADNHWVNLWSASGSNVYEWVIPAGDTSATPATTDIILTVAPETPAPWEPTDGIAIAGIAALGLQHYRSRLRAARQSA